MNGEFVAKLRAACDAVLADGKPGGPLAPHDVTGDGKPETFCNVGVRRIAEAMGCKDFTPDMNANAQVDMLEKKWTKIGADEAQARADQGGLIVAGKKYPTHGHVAVVYPGIAMAYSGTWQKLVPVLANIGKTCGLMATSMAFPVKKGEPVKESEPGYYAWPGLLKNGGGY